MSADPLTVIDRLLFALDNAVDEDDDSASFDAGELDWLLGNVLGISRQLPWDYGRRLLALARDGRHHLARLTVCPSSTDAFRQHLSRLIEVRRDLWQLRGLIEADADIAADELGVSAPPQTSERIPAARDQTKKRSPGRPLAKQNPAEIACMNDIETAKRRGERLDYQRLAQDYSLTVGHVEKLVARWRTRQKREKAKLAQDEKKPTA